MDLCVVHRRSSAWSRVARNLIAYLAGAGITRFASSERRIFPGVPTRTAAVAVLIAVATGGCGISRPPSVWVENRSAQATTFFIYDLGAGPTPYYVVPPHTTAHVGSEGLHTRDVLVNVLGWRHEEGHVGPCRRATTTTRSMTCRQTGRSGC